MNIYQTLIHSKYFFSKITPILICIISILFCSCQKENTQPHKKVNFVNEMSVDNGGLSKSIGIIQTKHGNIEFKFYPKQAPNTVNRIIALIKQKFYDGLTFHRTIPNYLIQTGDPTKTGMGGSGVKIPEEFNSIHHVKGTLSMARTSAVNSADSQFYITLSRQKELDNKYTVFGQVTKGFNLLNKIREGDKIFSLVFIKK